MFLLLPVSQNLLVLFRVAQTHALEVEKIHTTRTPWEFLSLEFLKKLKLITRTHTPLTTNTIQLHELNPKNMWHVNNAMQTHANNINVEIK